MNKKTIRLNESDLIKLIKRVINEQPTEKDPRDTRVAKYRGGGEGTQGDRDIVSGEFKDIVTDFTIPGGMFLNGVEEIDTNSPEFKEALNKIKKVINAVGGQVRIGVQGGASKVGYKSNYDNKSLANRRRDNFITAIKKSLGNLADRINFETIEGKVGDATVKNSDAAKLEQFVKITYPDKISIYNQKLVTAKDKTDVAMGRLGGRGPKEIPVVPDPDITPKGNPYMIVKIYYKQGEKDSYKKKILQSTGSNARELTNYQAAKDCGLKFE